MKIKSTKLLAILLAVCMMFSFSSVVFAANLPAMPAGGLDEILGIYNQLDVSQKVGLLDDVYTALEDKNLLADDTFKAFKDFHTEVKNTDENQLESLFNEKVENVAKDTIEVVQKEDSTVDVKELTGVVTDVVVNTKHIDETTKGTIVDTVIENLGNANVGVAIPAKLMEVYNYLSDNKLINAEQKLDLMQLAVGVLNGDEVDYEKTAAMLFDILAANKNISIAQIFGLINFVFDLYEEEIADVYAKAFAKAKELGLVDKAVKVLELADSKLAEAAEIVRTDLTGMALADELLEEIELADATFDEIIALLKNGSEFKKVLGLKDNLVAHLDVIKTLSYEHTETGLAKLIDDVRALYDAALEATYTTYQICGGEHVYVALGGSETYKATYVDDFKKALNAELTKNKEEDGVVTDNLFVSNLAILGKNVSAETVVDYVTGCRADIEKADIITFNMGAVDTLLTFAVKMNTPVEWADYLDPDTIALAEKAIAKLNVILAEEYDAKTIENIELIAENLVYAVVSYGVETYKALETIVGFNNNKAQIAIIGMANPFVNVSINGVPFEGIFDRVIEATDIYNGIYAMFSDKVTFVSVSDVKPANATPVELSLDDPAFETTMINLLTANSELKTSHEVVKNLLEAVSLNGDHSWDKTNSNRWVCTVCGETKTTTTPVPGPVPSGPSAPVHFNCDGGENCYCNKYTDLDNTMWYHQGVCYMIKHGYMIGIGDGKWAPEQIITRAEIATILWRIAGSEEVDYALDFSDVEADMWYTEAIEWAVSEEIFLGYGDGKFGPNDQITREQLVLVMYRYELDNGKKITADFDMTTVSDAEEISEWAVEAMTWALDCGLIIGTDVDVLTASPLKTATRAEVAMIFYRKLDNLLK